MTDQDTASEVVAYIVKAADPSLRVVPNAAYVASRLEVPAMEPQVVRLLCDQYQAEEHLLTQRIIEAEFEEALSDDWED